MVLARCYRFYSNIDYFLAVIRMKMNVATVIFKMAAFLFFSQIF